TGISVNFPGLAGFVLGGIVCVLGLRLEKRWARPSVIVLALLGVARLLAANYSVNPTVPRSFYTFHPPVLSHFEGSPGTFRVVSLVRFKTSGDNNADLQTYINFQSLPAATDLPTAALHAFQDRLLLSTGSMLSGVEEGINIDVERSLPPYLYDLWFYLMYQAPGPYWADLILGRTNVKYIIRASPFEVRTRRLVERIQNGSPQPSCLYQDLYAMPRVYVAGSSIFSNSSLDTLRRMASADFNMHDHVILAADAHSAPDVQGAGAAGQAEIVARPSNAVVLRADLSRPGYVVLLDRYDPNWHAKLDGREVPVLRANQIFRAVYAPVGRHDVRFYYRQRGLKAGLVISLSTLVLLGFLYWCGVRLRLL
ncbi:MAG: YfhO family protein, partial [Acidobacteriia bacterium]|nr:YfhO family protein [Terriglobia bacterium]